ncbi:MAG: hypothetical protein R3E42_08790 [Burkholderiaceae bacterium]
MKDYLRSAADLIKQYAWAFPPSKTRRHFEPRVDIQSLDAEELRSGLDFAFLRYFEDSGLFGTVEDCLGRVEQLKRIGVDEVACLIDYGIPSEKVMEVYPLAEVLPPLSESQRRTTFPLQPKLCATTLPTCNAHPAWHA